MSTSTHPLFDSYPLKGEAEISTGRVPTPYHTYDGHGMLIGGMADLPYITELLQQEQVTPMQTPNGRAVIGFWIVEFSEASLGPHHELQFSVLVSHHSTDPIEDHPLTLLKTLLVNPAARLLCFRLWNNSATAVAYNRELLGLPAQMSHGTIQRLHGQKRFQFIDEAGDILLEGQVREANRMVPQVGWSMLRLLGLRQALRAIRQPYLEAKVVNPIGDVLPYNAEARSYLASDPPIVQWFNPGADTLTIHQREIAGVNFQPQFIEHFSPFRFVYLQPESKL